MQTFLPYDDFVKSAAALDRLRLGKQRVETLQILKTIAFGSRWENHPAVAMWRSHELSLCAYGEVICREWISKGYRDSCLQQITAMRYCFREAYGLPPWLGDERFHSAHRAALLAKMPEHYGQFNWSEAPKISYFWPTKNYEEKMKRIDNSDIHKISLLLRKLGYSVSFSYDCFDKRKVIETVCCIEGNGKVFNGTAVKNPNDQQNLKFARRIAFDRALDLFRQADKTAVGKAVDLLPCPFCGNSEAVAVLSNNEIGTEYCKHKMYAAICDFQKTRRKSKDGIISAPLKFCWSCA